MSSDLFGIFIDDTGNNHESDSKYYHLKRSSWAAVIIPQHVSKNVAEMVEDFFLFAKQEFGERFPLFEFHFQEIYSSKTATSLTREEKLRIFQDIISIFAAFQLSVFFQTMSAEFYEEAMATREFTALKKQMADFDRRSRIKFSDYKHFALFRLLFEVKQALLSKRVDFSIPAPLYIDQGLASANSSIIVPGFENVFEDSKLNFIDSKQHNLMQLADFAAYTINRQQLIMQKSEKVSESNEMFLRATDLSGIDIVNIPTSRVDTKSNLKQFYEKFLEEERARQTSIPYPLSKS